MAARKGGVAYGRDLLLDQIRNMAESLGQLADDTDRSEPMNVLEWATKHRRIEGHDFTLDRHRPLIGIYEDDHPNIVLIKPAQRGASEYAVNYACFALDRGAAVWAPHKIGLNVGYIFPTNGALRDFSKERLGALVDETPYLRELFSSGRYQDVTFKQIKSSFLYLRGGWSKEGLKSFPADVMILDEYDEMNPGAVALADKRMNASSVRRQVKISTPILPGLGIHALYLQSDQRIYIQQCPNCRSDNQYDFFRDVTVDDIRFDQWQYFEPERIASADVALTCPLCEIKLDTEGRCAPGIWVAQKPEVTSIRGYHIPALAFPIPGLRETAVKAVDPNNSTFEEFMRQDLGVPFHSAGSGLTEEELVPLSMELPNGQLPDGPWERTTMGIDVGGRFHIKIASRKKGSEKPYVRFMGSVQNWADVDDMMDSYNVRMAVVDAYPEAHGAAAFASRHRGRAVVADYPNNMGALKSQLFAPEQMKAVQDGFVRINRTMALDAVQANVKGLREHWPRSITENPEVRSHMTAMARVTAMNPQGQVVASWTRLRADHLMHSSVYELVARMLTPKMARAPKIYQTTAKTQMPSGTSYRPPVRR